MVGESDTSTESDTSASARSSLAIDPTAENSPLNSSPYKRGSQGVVVRGSW